MKSQKENIQELYSTKIGKTSLSILTEKQQTECPLTERTEFLFKIENQTSKTVDFFINDLYRIFQCVQSTFIKYIERNIIDNIKEGCIKLYQIEIEAEGSSPQECHYKDKFYNYHLNRIAKKYTNDNIFCLHIKEDNIHVLSFFRIA
jgi:hypothetical protein